MTKRTDLDLRFCFAAITTLLIALPALAQQEKMDTPRPTFHFQLAPIAQTAQPSGQVPADQDDKDKAKEHKTQSKKPKLRRPPPQTTGYSSRYQTS